MGHTMSASKPEPTPHHKSQASTARFDDGDYQNQAAFRHALRQFLRFSEEQARIQGITPQQHIALLSVRGEKSYPRVTVGDVAEAMQMRHHSASLLVDRCVKRGLLDRQEDPDDRRRVMLSLTDDGQQVLDEITRANREELGTLDLDLFQNVIRKALDNAGAPPDATTN
jgi:DNA-binding MarR family transcriptional regulator